MSQQVSRRSLFTVPPIRYQPVVSLDGSLCASDIGCRQCADACPVDALSVVDGRIVLDRSRCEGCAVCASVCPREALDLATASRAQVDAEVGALLGANWPEPPAPRALLFVCERNASALERLGDAGASYPPAWLPVTAPCTGAVSAARVLGCLAAGADAVGIVECGGACPHGQAERVAGTVEYCRDLLSALARPPHGVRLLSAAGPALAEALNEPLKTDAERATGDVDAAATLSHRQAGRAVLALAERHDGPSPDPFEHPSAPLAIVEVDEAACTACGACARACPTEALMIDEGDDAVALSFDPTLCTGCGLCAGRCPEAGRQALSVEPITDIEALRRGRVTLYEDRTSRCELCGGAVAPAAMLQRLETLLDGDVNAATLAAITTRCTSCRATGGPSRAASPGARNGGTGDAYSH
jgi:ferredoxin